MGTDPLIGEVVDRRYRVLERLGTGGMGSVYLAEHLTLARKFAIKVLRQEFCEQPEFLARFLRESRAATEIDHPNVIEVIDTGTLPDDRAYYVMEHLQGEDLSRTLRRHGRLPWSRVRHIALQICDGLEAAHERGMVHRDLKPANCFRVTRRGDEDFIKLLDFGIVKLIREHTNTLTADGALLGTTHYMAPEQAMGLAVDHRVDIYALGVMLYQLISGRHPFPGRNGVEMLYAILHDAPVPLRDATPDVDLPAAVVAVVERAMHRDRDLRTPSMAALAAELRATPVDAPAPREAPPAEPPPPSTSLLIKTRASAGVVGPSHRPTQVRAEPSFDSKVTAERAQPEPSFEILNADSARHAGPEFEPTPTTRVPGPITVVAPTPDAPLLVEPPSTSPSTFFRNRWLAAAALVLAVGGAALLAARDEPVVAEAPPVAVDRREPATPPVAPIKLPVEPAAVEPAGPVELAVAEEPAGPELAEPAAVEPAGPVELAAAEEPAAQPAELAEPDEEPAAEPGPPPPPRPASSGASRPRKSIDAVVLGVKQQVQRRCRARLTAETVEIDVWIEAKTGKLRRSQVAPPHDRTSIRACVEDVFAAADFPAFAGRDYRKVVTAQIRPKGA